MEAAVWIISMCMAAFGPVVFSVVAGNICGRHLEHVSRRLGGWTGLVMGIAAVYAPLAKPKLFIAIWVGGLTSDESWARFHTVTAIVIAVAVTMTFAACFGVNRYREWKGWNRW